MFFKINIVLFLFLFLSCNSLKTSNQIGEVSKGNLTITTNADVLKKEWNNLLKDLKFESELNSFKIIKDFDTNENSKVYYLLVSSSDDKTIKVGAELIKKGNKFYFPNPKEKHIIICHGTTDCFPKKFKNDDWGCDCAIDSLLNCKKTESYIIKE